MTRRQAARTWLLRAGLGGLCLLAAGCRHNNNQVAYQPPPPPAHRSQTVTADAAPMDRPAISANSAIDTTSLDTELATAPPGFFDDISGRPVVTETGVASWYGPPYHHRAAADGTIFDQDAMTGAHRTLPLGTTVRVTNLTTGQQVLVRITDRGPFVRGRVIDLSMGAAKAVGLYRAGVGQVRVEAFNHPNADPDGRWCVQTGAFKTERDALDLKGALMARYRGAKVSEFQGPTGYWVRIDPAAHDKTTALKIEDWIGAPDVGSQAYLVRVD